MEGLRDKPAKPLGRKAYGTIGHLPLSRMGPGDHRVPEGQCDICIGKVRDKNDEVIVQEKLDGSCVAVARLDGTLHVLGRAGYPAYTSPYRQHWMFADWATERAERFAAVLEDGERLVGEWLAQAHGTRYNLEHREPFVAFDLMVGTVRACWCAFMERVGGVFSTPTPIHFGPIQPVAAMKRLGCGFYGAAEQAEGIVYRVERRGDVDFLAKYVRADKVDGKYLPEVCGTECWNWKQDRGE